jgi:hypothetical protein
LDTTGTITNFTTTPQSHFQIGGDGYEVQGAGQSWSLANPDPQTLRLQVRPGDQAWYDAGHAVDRDDVALDPTIPVGTPISIDYQFMVEPNGPNGTFVNTASWFTTAEMNGYPAVSSPPFEIGLVGNQLHVMARYCPPGQTPTSSNMTQMTLWTDPNPIQPGQYNDIRISANVSDNSSGYLDVWVNGTQVVDYHGPLGYGTPTYWEYGLYRNGGPSETVTADFRNMTLVTGSQAVGWTGVGGTTSSGSTSSPTTPTVTPAVTQATASPGTGTEHVGDTVTLTLGFNEAVTVTGTPTLSLNDGGTATYVGGSGTSALTFRTTVASTDTNTSALAITGVNLPSGASIKDASGVAADLAGAVKTFSGLQVDPTSSTTGGSTSPSDPASSTAPVLTIADTSLSVTGGGGTVDLGASVATTDPNDVVTVNITGLPGYETITDKLDGQTFNGKNITLTAAQVDSGLTLQSNFKGNSDPVATLTLTATATDPVTGAVTTAAPQTISVKDPRPATATTTTSPQTATVTDHSSATSTSTGAPAGHGFGAWGQHHHDSDTSAGTTSAQHTINAPDHPHATAASAGALANHGFALLQQHMDSVRSTLATTAPQAITLADHLPATGTTTASLASQSFAVLNQYLAGNSGRVDPGQIVAAVSQGAGWSQESFLARPQH